MATMRPNQLVRDDIVLLEVSVGRYYDMLGKAPNWGSTRVLFRLEAVSLLRCHDAKTKTEEDKNASSSTRRNAPMNVSI